MIPAEVKEVASEYILNSIVSPFNKLICLGNSYKMDSSLDDELIFFIFTFLKFPSNAHMINVCFANVKWYEYDYD